MATQKPLMLKGRTVPVSSGYCATVEVDGDIHSKLNDAMFGFEIWTEPLSDVRSAISRAEIYIGKALGELEYEIKWR